MSIDLDPSQFAYEPPPNVCVPTFGLNMTPDTLFLTFNDIKKGDAWVAADGEPPNGIWAINPSFICFFLTNIGGYVVQYDMRAANTIVQITTPNFVSAFFKTDAVQGVTWLANGFTTPVATHFWDGWCSITSAITSNQKNLEDILLSLGEDRAAGRFVTPRPKDSTETVHTFSWRSDHTNVKIRFDDS